MTPTLAPTTIQANVLAPSSAVLHVPPSTLANLSESNIEKKKGIQDDQGVERRMGEKPRASHISPETLDISDSDQSDLKLDSADVTTKPYEIFPTNVGRYCTSSPASAYA